MDVDESTPLLPNMGRREARKMLLTACILLTIAQGLERMSTFGIDASLVDIISSYPICALRSLNHWMETATVITHTFVGVMFALSLPIGYISDAFVPRHIVVIIGYFLHIGGVIILLVMGASYNTDDANATNSCESLNNTAIMTRRVRLCSYHNNENDCTAVIWISISLIILGSALIRTNLIPLAAIQVKQYLTIFYTGRLGKWATSGL